MLSNVSERMLLGQLSVAQAIRMKKKRMANNKPRDWRERRAKRNQMQHESRKRNRAA